MTPGDTKGSDRWDTGSGERKRDRSWEKGSWRKREWGYGWTKARQKGHRGHGEKKEKRKVKHIEGGATCDTKKLSDVTAPSLEVNLFWAAENR